MAKKAVFTREERAESRFTAGVVAALTHGTALPPPVEVGRCIGGFTVRTPEGFFVVTVKKVSPFGTAKTLEGAASGEK